MKAAIRDKSLLGSLEPPVLAGYLKSRKWEMIGRMKPDVPVFAKNDSEVFLPMSRKYADYALRVAELLSALAADEKRSELEVFEDLLHLRR